MEFSMKHKPRLSALFLGVLLSLGMAAHAADAVTAATLIPAEDFARQPKLRSVSFSPDGRLFAALQEVDGRMNLTVGDLKARKLTRVTSFTTIDVQNYQWISGTRLLFSLNDAKKGLAEQRGGGLFALNWDGSEPKELSPTWENCESRGLVSCRQTHFLQRIDGSADEILAVANDRDAETEDVYRLNTRTGKKTLLTSDNPGKVREWFLDKDGVPRAALSEDSKKLGETFWYRDSATSPWRKISSVNGIAAKRVKPAAFDADGTLFVYSDLDSDKYQLYVFDAVKGQPGELVAANANVDLSTARPLIRLSTRKILGFRVDADKPEWLWLDDNYAKMQALLDASLTKGNQNDMTSLDDGRVLVNSWSDRDPGSNYLYDPQAKQLQELLRPTDWIKPEQMSGMQVVRYKARDGLEIPSYLTLPQGKPATKLPLIAWIHGGPWVRDHWGFQPDVQFLASRGYAVFQPNYRGSTGFGGKHLQLSFKQYGQTMQDDITDGIRHLIAQGIVDPARVCIGGGSYGGYATMQGLVKEPDMFRCGINEAGVVDLIWAQELGYTDFNSGGSEAAEAWYKVTMGDVKADRALLEQYSPRLHADRIKAPVMIVHGAGDRRVPIKHAEGMRDALLAAGKKFEWVIYPEEGHGFIKPENRVDRYRKIEAFLHKNLDN
jgi:dipeptidyl aminopeptidase/acylaminoacyl peptidase